VTHDATPDRLAAALVRPGVVVRSARPDEWGRAGEIAEEAYRAAGHLETDTGYDAVLRDVASRAVPGPVLVAVSEGRLVGTVTITPPGSPHAEIAGPGEMEFRYLGVEAPAWGTGVARALVDAVVEHAREAGAGRLVCCVIAWNEAAHRLYLRYGFRRAPGRDWTPVPGIDLLAYEYDL
jgi:RimJ/RimL family protein N-acetyltransferase